MSKISMNVDTGEARLLAVHRTIREYVDAEGDDVIEAAEAGQILKALETVTDLEALESDDSFSGAQMKALIKGFVHGVVASRFSTLAAEGYGMIDSGAEFEEQQEQLPDEIAGETISGGPTGGIVVGQETGDPRYVKQTGPRAEEDR